MVVLRWIEELNYTLTPKQKIALTQLGKHNVVTRRRAEKKFGKRVIDSLAGRGLVRRLNYKNRKYYQVTDMGRQVL